ncbi:MAG TPA: ribonuclease PH [Alphaproteobacteria bacterium]|nr:ribonuclease PH [Alphaproteobacteria bacterium]
MVNTPLRPSGRQPDQMRVVKMEIGVNKYAEGSCFIQLGNTHLLCTASVDNQLPGFLRNTGKGWVTGEYGMLPRATATRSEREASRGKLTGRTQEIQRLIGRSLRAVTNLVALGERQIFIDCDVIQADGGTRTAAITGGYVALHQALARLVKTGVIKQFPLQDYVAAISCGIYRNTPILDLEYIEDSNAEVDSNFVFTGKGDIIEIQSTAEKNSFTPQQLIQMLDLAQKATRSLVEQQKQLLATLTA